MAAALAVGLLLAAGAVIHLAVLAACHGHRETGTRSGDTRE